MAIGDIIAAEILDDSWRLKLTISGFTSGVTYNLGLTGANIPSATGTPYINLTSSGYVGTTLTGKSRTSYVQFAMRKPYPSGAYKQEVINNGNLEIQFSLSEAIFQKDIANYIVIPSGIAYNGSGLGEYSNYYSGAVTNNSTGQYRDPRFMWTWPGYQRHTTGIKCKAFAYQYNAHSGKPGIECVVFSANDGTNFVTGSPVTNLSFDSDMPSTETTEARIPEYIDTLSTTTLNQSTGIFINAIAYPQIGDTPFNTQTTAWTPSELHGTLGGVCDKNGTYGITYAVVDVTNGSDPGTDSDTGKWVGDGSDPGDGSGVTAYASIARAIRAIRNYNNTVRSRNDAGGGIIFLKAGNYNWMGSSVVAGYGNPPNTWITIRPFTGLSRSDVVITDTFGNTHLSTVSDKIRFYNLTITSSTNNTFSNIDKRWFDQCEFNSAGTGIITGANTQASMTHCKLTQMAQGFRHSVGLSEQMLLMRGCEFAGFDDTVHVFCCIGNYQSSKYASSTRFVNHINGYTGPRGPVLLAFNKIFGWEPIISSVIISFGSVGVEDLNGFAIIQNIFEHTTGAGSGIGKVGSSENINNYPINDCFVWHNLFLGQRMQFGYNSAEAIFKPRFFWSIRNNVWDVIGSKSDEFPDSTHGASGVRQGNWMIQFGNGCSGNVNIGNIDITGPFPQDFVGLSGYNFDNSDGITSVWAKFTNRKAANEENDTDATGFGDYTLQDDSPLRSLQRDWVLLYDIDGNERQAIDAAGAYSQWAQTVVLISIVTLLQRIHTATTLAELTTLSAEADYYLDTYPVLLSYFIHHWGREVNKRCSLLGESLIYTPTQAGFQPIV